MGWKLEKPVCHYSLNWAPDETPERQEMSRAVDESLKALGLVARKALGLEKHQALIVAPVHFAAGARQTAGARRGPSSRTSSRIRRARSPENAAAGRPPRAPRGATRGLGCPRRAGGGGRPWKGGGGGGGLSPPRRPRTSRRADGRALSRARQRGDRRADVPYPWEAHPPGRIGASPGSLRLDRVATFRQMESRSCRHAPRAALSSCPIFAINGH